MRRSSAEQNPILLAFGVLFAVAFVIVYWQFCAAIAAAVGVFLAARAAARRQRRRQREHAAIAARADCEHAAIMRGDERRGTFGQYQPARWR